MALRADTTPEQVIDCLGHLGNEFIFNWCCADCRGPLSVIVNIRQNETEYEFGTSSVTSVTYCEPWPITQVEMRIICRSCGEENGHIATPEWISTKSKQFWLEEAEAEVRNQEWRERRWEESKRQVAEKERIQAEDRALAVFKMRSELG